MGQTLSVNFATQAPGPLTTPSQGAQFSPQMTRQTNAIVLDNTCTGKLIAIMIIKHPTNGISMNRCLLWIPVSNNVLLEW